MNHLAEINASLTRVAEAVAKLPRDRRVLVAIDGLDGAGKTTFADELGCLIDRPGVRASVDDFHNPSAIRYRLGRDSPEGYYLDSFDLDAIEGLLLAPFSDGEPFRRCAFDYKVDRAVEAESEDAPGDAALILDGLFVHRARLRGWWDLSVLLDVAPTVAAERMERRDGAPTRRRYLRGQELYFADAKPPEHASLVVPW